MKFTTLNKIKIYSPCREGWRQLLEHLGKTDADDEPLYFLTILGSNGLDDALWCCRTTPEYNKEWRLFAVWCARQVQHLLTNQIIIDAMDIAERFEKGDATEEDVYKARTLAWDAQRSDSRVEIRAAAMAVAWYSAGVAARDAARYATFALAEDAAIDSARTAQEKEFRRIIND